MAARHNVGAGPVLAVDPGAKRLGLAISDPLGIGARPLRTIPSRGTARDAAKVVAIAREEEAVAIVIGLAVFPSGDESPSAAAARALGEVVGATSDLPVHYWDESGTTVEANRRLSGPTSGRRTSSGKVAAGTSGVGVDAVAAAVILQEWLASRAHELSRRT